ncbi:hypothetical protein MMC16_003342 [Acarospora aff. strigata]|nr:hypothetical protein [Acarospora aff. strigata]
MAPIKGKRPGVKARATNSGHGSGAKSRTVPTSIGDSESFRTTKKDKRTIKHSTFVSRIEKADTKAKKRRRPSKKLVANLGSLANALPDDGGIGAILDSGDTKIRHKSLKSRPGAMKRKEKLETMERERFSRNMAQMVGATATAPAKGAEQTGAISVTGSTTSSSRWAALRGFIQQTMEQKPEFKTT